MNIFALRKKGGYAAITTTIFMLIIALTIITAFTFFTLQEVGTNRAYVKSINTHYISESGIEDAIYRIITQKQIDASETLGVGDGTTAVTVTSSGKNRTIRSEGKQSAFRHNLETTLVITTQDVSFVYGAQVGEGGLDMDNNSSISGSVYSSGSITGDTGAVITGDAFVAAGAPASINQSWTVQNADTPVGVWSGNIITVVDAGGGVGEYTSLALDSDDLAAISYVDATNKDLKYARCMDNNCGTKNLVSLDTSQIIDEVTSLTLGSDGFARISYYDDGKDDLKLARCANANCTSSTITSVDTASNVGDFSSVSMGSDGLPRIGYWHDSNTNVLFAQCTNADCSTKNINVIDSVGNVGEYISTKIGSDGFARMSYYDATNGDLKLIRCTNANCATKVITTVDTTGNVGAYTSLALGSDGFARISYYDDTNDDLKFARCTNADCTAKSIVTVDSGGTVGSYTSLALGSDGFARISYYGSSNGDLKFAQCLNDTCSSKNISIADSAGTVGKHTSLALGSDGFARISYYDSTNADLKFARCTDAICSASNPQVDVAQSFKPSVSGAISQVDLYLKKIGSPVNAMLSLIKDSGGSPSTNPTDILATGLIGAGALSTSYAWQSIVLFNAPVLTAETTYWLVIDAATNNANYIIWGNDSAGGYTRGLAKKSADFTLSGWSSVVGDLNFRTYMGVASYSLDTITVGGNANAHTMNNVTVGGNANAVTLNNGVVGGNINVDSMANCTIGGNASYNAISDCAIIGSQTTPTTPPTDPPRIDLPITASTITNWKQDASLGGVIAGDYSVTTNVSLGPKEITGNLLMGVNNTTLTITGTIYVRGNIDISNGSNIRCAASYGEDSCVIVNDGWIHLQNNGVFQGSGTAGSYFMFLTTAAGGGHHNSAIDLHNNASGAIFYAQNGLIYLHNNVTVTEIVGYKVHLENNATLIYESGLENAKFSSGPSGGFNITNWQEVK